ncbi:MAG: biopolymer transporter ExbD [candidate division WOR-3 bacterium]|nr:biopolymer transporter ExbD [candidate division WOR-3 bacterium]MDW8113841.1 biopolymer transporter ExbD [candidate division WOR-3 bacterium]
MRKFLIKRETPEIPSASTGDIAFLLIIFFMLTTVLRTEMGLKVNLPQAEATERLIKRRNVIHIWVDKTGKITIDDNVLDLTGVTNVMLLKVADNPELIAEIMADSDVDYGKINDLLEALKEAQAFKIVFATEYKKIGG